MTRSQADEVTFAREQHRDGPCVVIRIYEPHIVDAYAEAMTERARLAHGRIDVGFADDAAELAEAAEWLRAETEEGTA